MGEKEENSGTKKKFSNEALPPPEVKFTPQNLQLLFFTMSIFGFLPLWKLQTLHGLNPHNARCYDAFPRKVSHAEKHAPYSDWSLN